MSNGHHRSHGQKAKLWRAIILQKLKAKQDAEKNQHGEVGGQV